MEEKLLILAFSAGASLNEPLPPRTTEIFSPPFSDDLLFSVTFFGVNLTTFVGRHIRHEFISMDPLQPFMV